MFTPQRVSSWSLKPHKNSGGGGGGGGGGSTTNPRNVDKSTVKGKYTSEGPPPPLDFLGERNGGKKDGDGDMEVWDKFREAGLLNEANLKKKDREGLIEMISKLENELYEYQYNMGLLLIQKNGLDSNCEELRQQVAELQELLKRDQTRHSIVISEVEMREENLRKALGVEKQCVADLEKALHEMRAESAEMKYTSDTKMAEAHALVASLEEKSLEVEAKLHAADAKLAEATRKSSEVDRKLKEVEARESALRSERHSLNAEREVHEEAFSKQREELREWEKTLQEREERLVEGRRVLNQREERANENDKTLKKKEKDLDEVLKKIESTSLTLRSKEDDLSRRLAELVEKERVANDMKLQLEKKEEELLALEKVLNVRERAGIQKLLDEHKALLDLKKHDFELEMEQKRKSLDEELKSKIVNVEKKEVEVNHKEEKISKREQALDKKMEKTKEKEKDLELKLKDLKEREKHIKAEEKNLDKEKKQILNDKENLQILISELEKKRAEVQEENLRLHKEEESLKVTEEEKVEHLRLKSELKQEIEKVKHHEEVLLKEHENLKQDRENFEKEWDVLDEKKAEISQELKHLLEEKASLAKMKHDDEESLRNEKIETQDYVRRELESLRLQKDAFEASIEHERSVISQKAQSEKKDMLREFELQKKELEDEMQNIREEMERNLRQKERTFEEQRVRDLDNLNYLREVASREMEDMERERARIEKDKQKITVNKQHLEEQQHDMQTDIDKLDSLIKKLKIQREHFKKLVEKYRTCKNCGEICSEFILSEIQTLQEMEDSEIIPLPRLARDNYGGSALGNQVASERQNNEISPQGTGSGSGTPGGGMSWLRKCTSKIINLSPLKRNKDDVAQDLGEGSPTLAMHDNIGVSERVGDRSNVPEPSFGLPCGSIDMQKVQSDNSIRGAEDELTMSYDEHSYMGSKGQEVPEDSEQSAPKRGRGRPRGKRNTGVRRTHSVKAVVEEAKAFLGEIPEHREDTEPNHGNEDSGLPENEGDSNLTDKRTAGRKRQHAHASRTTTSEHETEDNDDARSDSITTGGARKRRQTVAPGMRTPGEKRYNLRRPKARVASAATKDLSDPSKGKEKLVADGNAISGEDASQPENAVTPSIGVSGDEGQSRHHVQVTTLRTTTKVQQFTSVMVDRVESGKASDADAGGSVPYMEMSEINGTPERIQNYGEEDESGSEVGYGEGEDDDEESVHPGEASIGKKLWTFFTT